MSGTSADRSLLSAIQHGMKTDLVSEAISNPPAGFNAGRDGWLYISRQADETPAAKAEDAVFSALIVGAYAAQCKTYGAECIAGYTVAGPGGADPESSRFLLNEGTEGRQATSQIVRRLRARLGDAGLEASSVSIEHPDGAVAIVDVETSHPQAEIHAFIKARIFRGLSVDGYLVRIRNGTGRLLMVQGWARLAQIGNEWIDPLLRGSF